MNEYIVIVIAIHRFRSAVQQFGGLVQYHVAGLHCHIMLVAVVVQDEQRPVFTHTLVHIDDGRDDMSANSIHMHTQHRVVRVFAT